ncbi:MAG TPA: phosphoribosylformylglycinamidine cyclo-ligase [Terriglobia bacterium]|jgi:phosphoribosylformylglycinamidine cyclo-ligase|nr:phosphoribosylformylglycinamidine cyclo-ligase [Terriglobia bacterium]
MRYSDAGVDIDAANRAKRRIRQLARRTFNPSVLRDVGAFGGFFAVDGLPRDAVLVSSVDGVGTKLKIAFALNRHHSVGADLVNHCVNDIAVHGAAPLFFLDYVASGRLRPDVVTEIVSGVAQACRANGCALVGGETAEMPGFYPDNEYDLAGCIVGWVGRRRIIDGRGIRPGDVVLGLGSAGLHTNGYSLARRVLIEEAGLKLEAKVPELGRALGDELLKPHRCYWPLIKSLLDLKAAGRRLKAAGRQTGRGHTGAGSAGVLKGLVHITGGGLTENPPRILPAGCRMEIDLGSWPVPAIYPLIARLGKVPQDDMLRTFNMGIGMMVVIAEGDLDTAARLLRRRREPFWRIGRIVAGGRRARGVQYVRAFNF